METESKYFLRKIKRGNIIKAYQQFGNLPKFGKVVKTEMQPDRRYNDGRMREVAICKPTEERPLDKVDFCLEWYKVQFIN